MAQPTNPELVAQNNLLNTQIPANKNAKVYDITIRYVFNNEAPVENIVLDWTKAMGMYASWQGKVVDISEVDQSALPPSSPEWADYQIYIGHPWVL